MRIITRANNAKRIAVSARRMLAAYENRPEALLGRDQELLRIDREIVALGDNPSPDDIDRIAARPLTGIRCDLCGTHCDAAVEMPTSDGATLKVCQWCIEAAVVAFDSPGE